jgi:hypothetical protein
MKRRYAVTIGIVVIGASCAAWLVTITVYDERAIRADECLERRHEVGGDEYVQWQLYYTVLIVGNARAFAGDVFDSAGRHTGPEAEGDATMHPVAIEHGIPNSVMDVSGGTTYQVEVDTSDTYRIRIHGLGSGNVSVRVIYGLNGDKEAITWRYPGSPDISEQWSAVMMLGERGIGPSSLAIDRDGDDIIDECQTGERVSAAVAQLAR